MRFQYENPSVLLELTTRRLRAQSKSQRISPHAINVLMPRKKTSTSKLIPIKDWQDSLPDAERGLWIDPDIWRRIKGEGGRRGVEGLPSTNRYLEYADLALRSAKKRNPKPAKSKNKSRSSD